MKHPIIIMLAMNIMLFSVPALAESNITYLECSVPGLEDWGLNNDFSVRINKNLETGAHSDGNGRVYRLKFFITAKSVIYKFNDNDLVTINRENLSANIVSGGPGGLSLNGECKNVKIGKVKL